MFDYQRPQDYKVRVEIIDGDYRLMALETFDSSLQGELFVNWWQNNRKLPKGGITMMRADRVDEYRRKNPVRGCRRVVWRKAWKAFLKRQVTTRTDIRDDDKEPITREQVLRDNPLPFEVVDDIDRQTRQAEEEDWAADAKDRAQSMKWRGIGLRCRRLR